MGEIADDLLFQFMDDLYEHPDEWEPPFIKQVKCRYCGEENVKWQRINGRWRLVTLEKEIPHRCKAFYIQAVKGELKCG